MAATTYFYTASFNVSYPHRAGTYVVQATNKTDALALLRAAAREDLGYSAWGVCGGSTAGVTRTREFPEFGVRGPGQAPVRTAKF